MSYGEFIALSAVLVVVLLGVLLLGWRSRRRRHADLAEPATPRDFAATIDAPILYVATTVAGDPYDRIAVHGLGYRARGRIAVGDAGVVLDLPGRAILIPRTDLAGVERATWTIDRVVEPGGLLRIGWTLGGRAVESYARVTGEDADVLDAIEAIAPAPRGGPTSPTPTDTTEGAAA